MQEQNFRNHPRYVPGFHFITFSVILAALVIAVTLLISDGINGNALLGLLVTLSLALLFFYTRQFATGNQDRIIRAEENLRCYELTGKKLDGRLSREQVIALRFADDAEYEELYARAINQKLSPKNIKKAIHNWRADHHRV